MEEINAHDSHRNKQPKIVACRLRVVHRSENDESQQSKRCSYTNKTHLLTNDGKNEICMPCRQITQSILRAVENALAQEPASTNRDLRLSHLISLPRRISFRIEKGQNPLLLVWPEHKP